MYLDTSSLWLFIVAALVLLAIPGPAVLYIVARSVDQGRTAGLVSAAGIALGGMVHVLAAVGGLSALLLTSATAFNIVKYTGALYLIYLGMRTILGNSANEAPTAAAPASLRRIFVQGAVVNILNPKTALFFFSFLPQFVRPEQGHVATQFAFLGLIFTGMALTSDSLWALLAGSARGWILGNARVLRRRRYFTGGTYIALGFATALTGHRK